MTEPYTVLQRSMIVWRITFRIKAAIFLNLTFQQKTSHLFLILLAIIGWNGIISITAAENSSFPSLGLSVPADITPGTYTFSQLSPPQSSYNVGTNWDDMYSAESNTGVLTITTHDESSDYISGTFSFTAIPNPGNSNTNSFEITEGEFSISY